MSVVHTLHLLGYSGGSSSGDEWEDAELDSSPAEVEGVV